MAIEWKNCCIKLGIVALLFFGIPLHVDKPKVTNDVLLFQSYMRKFNKHYKNDTEEYKIRFNNFQESLARIQGLNSLHPNDDSATYGPTKFSDLSPEEFSHHHLRKDLAKRLRKHSHQRLQNAVPVGQGNVLLKSVGVLDKLPDKVDWRERGAVTAVRSQKLCGACWAFCTIETVESMLAIRNGTLLRLSVQEAIDCAGNGNLGCNGGDICSLAEWLTENKIKIELEKDYPLTWQDDACKLPKAVTGVQVSSYSCLSLVNDETSLLKLLAYHGPVAVAVNALSWQYYVGGVIQFHCGGGQFELNHAVQIVGYDLTAPTPHYIVRNSWGTVWGDKGYLYVAIGSNMCGIANDIVTVNVA